MARGQSICQEARLKLTALHLISSIELCIGNQLGVPSQILTYATIDIMAWLDRDKNHPDVQRSDFIKWVDAYLLPGSQLSCTAIDLYAARCSLIHSYSAESKLSREGKARELFYAWPPADERELQTLVDHFGGRDAQAVGIENLLGALKQGVAKFIATNHDNSLVLDRARKFFTFMPGLNIDRQTLLELDGFLREQGIESFLFDVDRHCIEECQKLIRSQGASNTLSSRRLAQLLLSKVDVSNEKNYNRLVGTLRRMLITLAPSRHLILLDNYIFAESITDKQGYLGMFKDIFGPIVGSVKEVRFVTLPKHDDSLYQDVTHLLKSLNPQLLVSCSTTRDFHDRFWIADEARGLIVGTSLNGIGKRYSVVDNLSDEDTKEIVDVLKRHNLL